MESPDRVGEGLQIGVDHHANEAGEIDRRFPAEGVHGLGRIGQEVVHFGGAEEGGIGDDIFAPVEAA